MLATRNFLPSLAQNTRFSEHQIINFNKVVDILWELNEVVHQTPLMNAQWLHQQQIFSLHKRTHTGKKNSMGLHVSLGIPRII